LYGDWLTRTSRISENTRRFAGADSPRRISLYADATGGFSPLEPIPLYFAAKRPFQDDGCGKQLAVISPDLTRETYETPANLGVSRRAIQKKANTAELFTPSLLRLRSEHHLGRNRRWINSHHARRREILAKRYAVAVEAVEQSLDYRCLAFDAGTAYAAINSFRLDDFARAHLPHARFREIMDGNHKRNSGWRASNVVRKIRFERVCSLPERKGRSTVRFNDGDDWQPLQLNLPHTSMRDLAIHGRRLMLHARPRVLDS